MAFPTPTSPTLADLEYAYYSANTTSQFPYIINVADSTNTTEKINPNFVGYSFNVSVEDFTVTSESAGGEQEDVFGPDTVSIVTSDTTVTSEQIDPSKTPGGVRVVSTSDTTVTSESITATEA